MTSPGLFDIGPPTEIVSINGTDHKVRGLPLRIIVDLLKDYPAIIGMLGKGLTAEAVVAQGPAAVSLIIAAGYGMADDEKARKAAADLPLDVQLDLIAGIVNATLGGGAGPFADKVRKIYDAFKVMNPAEAQAETTAEEDSNEVRERKLQRMRDRLSRMQSQQTSNSSSPGVATDPAKFGT
jgi:hypothetical protein